LQKATEVAERIREMINSLPIPAGSENLHITVSTGISGCEGGVQSIDEIFHQADKALYQAKSAGRNTWVVFTQ
ncbi:MAG: diguanylate cyclase, partial [Cyanobacteria bacterium Co-bin8]|nr:diguanylate cyclase [Cyanobacteria bacterium Co-bin8]